MENPGELLECLYRQYGTAYFIDAKVIGILLVSMVLLGGGMSQADVVANEPVDAAKMAKAEKIILGLQARLPVYTAKGAGPFVAAIYDSQGNLVVETANSVVDGQCSHNHAEMNAIRLAEEKLGTYDLGPHHLSLYVTAEPCVMCMGGIMWSGIEAVYYGVPSKRVEEITGFDEGYKPDWQEAFRERGITVYGNIAVEAGEKVLQQYMDEGRVVYKPERDK